MSCLPIGRRLKRLGQVLSKMLPTSSKFSLWTNRREDDKENLMPESNKSQSTAYDELFSDSYLASIWQRKPSRNLSAQLPKWNDLKDDIFCVSGASFLDGYKEPDYASASSSGYGSFAAKSMIGDDSSLTNTQTSIPYSPLSSFNNPDNFMSDFYSDLNLNDLSSPSPLFENNNDDYNDLRREFEMNGRTKDLKEKDRSFSPSQCSTPMTNRKSQQWQPEDEFAFTYTDLIPIHPAPRPQYPFKKKIKPDKKSLTDHCVFCKNNGESECSYRSHTTKDAMGRVVCPKLRCYKCPICGAKDDKAHTVKYCPKKPIITHEDTKRRNFKI